MGTGDERKDTSSGDAAATPTMADLAHDLRNLVGLVRALAEELPSRMTPIDVDGEQVLKDLQSQSSLAMDALSLMEKWGDEGESRVGLGAWVWALRLRQREVALGEHIARGAHVKVSVPALMRAGATLVLALGRGGAVRVEADEKGAVSFEGAPGGVDQDAVERARAELTGLGLSVAREGAAVVRVGAGKAAAK